MTALYHVAELMAYECALIDNVDERCWRTWRVEPSETRQASKDEGREERRRSMTDGDERQYLTADQFLALLANDGKEREQRRDGHIQKPVPPFHAGKRAVRPLSFNLGPCSRYLNSWH
jgi:hypothetical protein